MKKVAALAHSGVGNLGDEATMAAFLHEIRRRYPAAEIRAFTRNPAETQRMHKVPAYPVRRKCGSSRPSVTTCRTQQPPDARVLEAAKRTIKRFPLVANLLRGVRNAAAFVATSIGELWFLAKSAKRLAGTDVLVIVGGGQLTDYFGGPLGFPATIFKWCLLARVLRARVVFLSIGAGPLVTGPGKFLLRRSLLLADYRSFRDHHSRSLIQELGIATDNHVLPDLVHALPLPRRSECPGAGVVGINPLPYYDERYWAESDAAIYQHHIETLAGFSMRLIRQGHKVIFFPTQLKSDPSVIQEIAEIVRTSLPLQDHDRFECPAIDGLDSLLSVIAQTDLVVASRFHGVVFSLVLGRPVIGLAYNRKTEELLHDVGLGAFVTGIAHVSVPWLVDRFQELQPDAEFLRQRIDARTSEYRVALEDQYDLLFGQPVVDAPILPSVFAKVAVAGGSAHS